MINVDVFHAIWTYSWYLRADSMLLVTNFISENIVSKQLFKRELHFYVEHDFFFV